MGVASALPLSAALPSHWGWENGPLENAQVVLLLAGCLTALWAALRQTGRAARSLWWMAAMIWLILAGRELAWGAAFLPPMGFDDHGPVISSRVLWYRPAVPWVCLALLLTGVIGMWRNKAFSRVLLVLQREHAWPWFRLAVLVVCIVLSTVAEGHGLVHLPFIQHSALIVAEELFESWGYLALWLAQWQVIRHMDGWARRLY
ncbi:hypothetical protein [Diaphorobacter caeni]|uniref:hypothetical protein n=1 Tax=Diaphorobacter caeni TaxID=2784387 RepID=UPI001E4E0412|nr:hypothetical protein [Diaphorobacter caeni]